MHMADALVTPAVGAAMYACTAAAAAISIYRIKKQNIPIKAPVMGVFGAFIFAAQMINFTIPGTGSSGHLCGGMLSAVVLGPEAGFITMIGILLIQCLIFADGGLITLGANVWNMGFYGCFIGGAVIWRLMTRRKMSKSTIMAASILGCVFSLQLGAFSVCLETLVSGVTELPFSVFVGLMQPIHLAIGAMEGVITGTVLIFVYESHPQMLYNYGKEEQARLTAGKVTGILGACALVIGGLLSVFASSNPDGLEWSIQKITGTTELDKTAPVATVAETIQNTTAVIPDYEIGGSSILPGILGTAMCFTLCVLVCVLLKNHHNKGKNKRESN